MQEAAIMFEGMSWESSLAQPAAYGRLNRAAHDFAGLGIAEQFDFEKLYLYSIVTHSTAIEGSSVTEIENALMFDEGIVPGGRSLVEQLMNLDLKRAYDFMLGLLPGKPCITVDLLKHLSSLVMRNTGSVFSVAAGKFDSSAGDLRLVNVSAGRGGRSYPGYPKVPKALESFCEWLNAARREPPADVASAYALSFEAHYRLVTIHPWVDGNGRMSRLLMNMLQMENGLLPSILRKERKAEYIHALSASQDEGDSARFVLFMMDAMTDFLRQSMDEFRASRDRLG